MSAALIEHPGWCPAVRLAGLTTPRIETYVVERRDDNGDKVCDVHCTRCLECGEINYLDLG